MPNVRVIPEEWEWDPEAVAYADMYGIPYEIVEAAASHPTHTELDPHSTETGWDILRCRRGDIVAVVGYREPTSPVILHCSVVLPFANSLPRQRTNAAGSGGGSTEPTSMRQLRHQIVARGFVVKAGGRHDRVESRDGEFLCALPISPSDARSIPNAWHTFLRAVEIWRTQQRVTRGNLLTPEGTPDANGN